MDTQDRKSATVAEADPEEMLPLIGGFHFPEHPVDTQEDPENTDIFGSC